MNCPLCKTTALHPHLLEDDLQSEACPDCGGYWLAAEQYRNWLERRPETPPEKAPQDGPPLQVNDSPAAKLCPACGRFLIRFKVGHGTSFHLDHCGNCGGIWLDANEWEILRGRNLHGQIHFVFSDAWQSAVARQERQEAYQRILLEKLGSADLAEIQRIKAWIDQHPHRSELYAFLLGQGKEG